MEKIDKIRKFAEVLKIAGSDGKITFIEALQIGTILFKAQTDFREVVRIIKNTEPEILVKEFGQSYEWIGRLFLNLNGLYAHATNLVSLFAEINSNEKPKTEHPENPEKSREIAETTAPAGRETPKNKKTKEAQ